MLLKLVEHPPAFQCHQELCNPSRFRERAAEATGQNRPRDSGSGYRGALWPSAKDSIVRSLEVLWCLRGVNGCLGNPGSANDPPIVQTNRIDGDVLIKPIFGH
jgi:hypothetical protein